MSKPCWEESPLWAKWLAMDGDGQWWWHSTKPTLEHNFEWLWSKRSKRAGNTENKELFMESLEPRP